MVTLEVGLQTFNYCDAFIDIVGPMLGLVIFKFEISVTTPLVMI